MKIEEISEIYLMISMGLECAQTRREGISLRKDALNQLTNSGIVKLAFDTRRLDQEGQYNPRRGLQNYNRSEMFITEATSNKLKNLKKIKDVLESIRDQYGGESEWQDSYCRVLLDTIFKSLRTEQKDGDFTDTQPGVGSLDYIEEMLFVRYRLELSGITDMSESEIKKKLLSKDYDLVNKSVNDSFTSKKDVTNYTYSDLIEKLFGTVKATKDNPEVERVITISIKDKLISE